MAEKFCKKGEKPLATAAFLCYYIRVSHTHHYALMCRTGGGQSTPPDVGADHGVRRQNNFWR